MLAQSTLALIVYKLNCRHFSWLIISSFDLTISMDFPNVVQSWPAVHRRHQLISPWFLPPLRSFTCVELRYVIALVTTMYLFIANSVAIWLIGCTMSSEGFSSGGFNSRLPYRHTAMKMAATSTSTSTVPAELQFVNIRGHLPPQKVPASSAKSWQSWTLEETLRVSYTKRVSLFLYTVLLASFVCGVFEK